MKRIFLFFSILFIGCHRGEVTDYKKYLNHNDTVKYVGKEQCRMCHAEIYDSYINTGMGKSFHHATKENSVLVSSKMSVIHDSVKNLSYKPFWKNDSLFLLEYRIKNLDTIHKLIQKIHYKIGSGHHTNSHIFDSKGYLYQAPYTYYTQDSIADLPPGYEDGLNTRFSREIGLECMSCHNAHSDHDPSSLNKYNVVPQGIDCERCHGPGEIHVQNKLAGDIIDTSKYIDYTIVNPAKLPKDLQFDMCQRCHLQGTAILNGLSSFEDFKPGMHLKDVMDVYLPRYKDNDQFIMASHADRLAQSACFKSDNLTCITCHNPHKTVTSLSNEYFDNKCKSCHDICEDKQIDNCVSCHMPKSNSLDIMHVNITDHRISIPKETNIQLKAEVFLGLQSVNNKNPSDISKAKAYLKRYEGFEQKSIYLDSALYYLTKTKDNFTSYVKYYYLKNNDKDLINYILTYNLDTIKYRIDDLAISYARIGEVFSRNGLHKEAESYFLKSIALMPSVVDFKLKYAVFLIGDSKYELALSILLDALESNPMAKELYLNVGYILILKKEYIVAETYLKKALSLDPDYILAYENLILLSRLQNKELDLTSYLNNILEIAPEHNLKYHIVNE